MACCRLSRISVPSASRSSSSPVRWLTSVIRAVVPLRSGPCSGCLDRVADLDVVAGVEPVRPAGEGHAGVPEFSVLAADRLGAGVELVEVFVGGLRDHDRGLARAAVGVRGVQRPVLGALLIGVEVDRDRGCRSPGSLRGFRLGGRGLGRVGRQDPARAGCASVVRAQRSRRRLGGFGPRVRRRRRAGSGVGHRPRSASHRRPRQLRAVATVRLLRRARPRHGSRSSRVRVGGDHC
jgi:hypothetical protein